MKVVTPSRSRHDSATITTDILFEDSEFTRQQLARKAAAIVRQALSPDSVLFSLPATAFSHRTDAYKTIADQIGPLASVRPLSNYDARPRRDLLIAAKFTSQEDTMAAIESGITVDHVVYKASPTVSGAENPLVRVQINLLHNADDKDLKDGLLTSLSYYGKVYQIRRVLCNGYFEGQLTATLDPQQGYLDNTGNMHEAQPLQRMLYLEAWDVFAPASFKGAAPICYYCRQAGHIRNKCPELAKRVCFGCGERGHTRRYCRTRDEELIAHYEQITNSRSNEQDDQEKDLETDMASVEQDQSDLEQENSEDTEKSPDDHSAELHDDPEPTALDGDMDVEDMDSYTEEDIPEKRQVVDSGEGINASRHAPYEVATTMKIDSAAEMMDLSSVKTSTKAKTDKIKRSLLMKHKSSVTSSKPRSLDLHPVVPPLKSKDNARRAQ